MVNFIGLLRDSLTNLVSRMGTERDKAAHSFYALPVLSEQELLNAYRGAWLPRKIIDIPALDSVKKWRNWQSGGDKIEDIEAEEKRLDLRRKVLRAKIVARLFGGAAIHIGTGEEDLGQPLDVERVGKGGIKHLTVLLRRHLAAGEIDRDVASEWYGQPGSYQLTAGDKAQVAIHPSRLVILQGNPQPDPDLVGGTDMAWGDSVLQTVLDAVKQADGTAANIASLVFEAKNDIIRIPNFMASLKDDGYTQKILERYRLAAMAKGINGVTLLDKEEEYESKSASFGTLPDVLDRFMQLVAGAADIPMTRLFGQSPAGMNATGESDLRNYYDRISEMQELEMTPAMHRLDEALIRSALGSRPAEVFYEWAPLWGLSDKEKADIFKIKADGARAIAGSGGASPPLIPIDALSDSLVNALVEDGSLPGLDEAIDKHGALSEQEEDPEEVEAAAATSAKPARVADAAPRPLYVRRDVVNATDIIAWAKSQGFETTLPARDLHVTIAYSKTPIDWMKVGESWSFGEGKGKLTVNAGGPRLMERFGEATVLLFSSSDLQWRHMAIREAGASWDHPEYQPHITISYKAGSLDLAKVEPYRGVIELGPEVFEEIDDNWQGGVVEDGGAPVGGATFRRRR